MRRWGIALLLAAILSGAPAPKFSLADSAGATHSDAEWRAQLTPEQFEVVRNKGTERAFSGKFWDNHEQGVYTCVACGGATPTCSGGSCTAACDGGGCGSAAHRD